ncbi:hypothetical protein Q7P37_003868 [Cladosporium fusiforme]
MARVNDIPAPAAQQATSPDPDGDIHLQLTSPDTTDYNSDVSALTSPDPSFTLSPQPVEQRNQAPGIPDRRKSVRPSSRSHSKARSREVRKSRPSPISMSIANMSNEMKLRDEDESPTEKSDAFEDAVDTPRANGDSDSDSKAHGNTEQSPEAQGLGIQGASSPRSSGEGTKKEDDAHNIPAPSTQPQAMEGSQEAQESQNSNNPPLEVEPPTPTGPNPTNPGAVGAAGAEPPSPTKSTSTQRNSMSAPQRSLHGRQRSVSPRFPVNVSQPIGSDPTQTARETLSGRQSPVKEMFPDVNGSAATSPRKNSSGNMSPPPQPGNLARKASSGFGALFGRMGSIRKARSPAATRSDVNPLERRGTGSSMASVDAARLGSIADGPEDDSYLKPSLKDRFAVLRAQEEHGNEEAIEDGDGESVSREALASPTKEHPEPRTRRASSLIKSPPVDRKLPPGTASGMTAGPAAESGPVDWDLWQSLVYEGPTAVQRTGGAEIAKAIANGIPPAIRGVVWQVLADSKSEDLEALYKTLKARGTEAEQKPTLSRGNSYFGQNAAEKEKESAISSRSSVHSDSSTPATSTLTSPPQSVDGVSSELKTQLLAEKHKRDAAALVKLEKAIKRDLGARTSFSKYAQSAGLQDGLFGLCKSYALFDETVGYAQGINFVAMPLLFNMSEEEAFTLLVRLMHKYDLRSLFEPEMPGLHLHLYKFERLLEDLEPALYCHLKRRHVGPQLYATQWFLTLFAYRFPLQLVLRVYDLLFSEGLTAILKFGIVLMQRNKTALLEMKDMSQITNFLKEKIFDVYIDKSPSASSLLDSGFFGSVSGGADKELYRADEMVHDATAVIITDETLAQYTAEWEESQRLAKETEQELETLRSGNTHLTSYVRTLEERAQQHDVEHVNMASDMVRLKMDNDNLADDNEGLKVQVVEFQKMVDQQPAEVEEKLKSEMDRIMQRNIEVQNENRALKEELDEMEREFVNAKMMHAQTLSEHDTLKQRLASVQAMLNSNK